MFEEKIMLSPKDMNNIIDKDSINTNILDNIRSNLEGKCSQHGFVIPNSIEILSRSMGHLEHGRYTGNVVFYVQLQGKVYNPANGTRISGKVEKKNKMGLYIIYEDAIRILIPRDLHIGDERFDSIEPGDIINIEIRKSRFQIKDLFILSIGVLVNDSVPNVPAPQNDEPLLGSVA